MIKQLIFFVLFLFVLGACSQQKPDVISSDYITIEDVENILTEKGFKLERETDLSSQNVFIQELNRIKPEIYSLVGNSLSVYVFPSASDRGEAIQRFEELTASMQLVEHKAYGIKNILVFYVSDDEMVQNRLFEALQIINYPLNK